MSSRRPLPDDLAACEAKLAALHLPASLIDRDQLMYRAGYAAAEASLALGDAVTLPAASVESAKRFDQKRVLGWSAASAAIAATIAVAITLSLQPGDQLAKNNVDQAPQPSNEIVDDGVDNRQANKAAPSRSWPLIERWTDISTNDALSVGGPMLQLRSWTLRQPVSVGRAWDDSHRVSDTSPGVAPMPTTKSHRDLLEEFLPERDRSSQESGGFPFLRLFGASSEGAAI